MLGSRAEIGLLDEPPIGSFEAFIGSERFGDHTDHRFHLSLLPVPYVGDLARADIFLLQLNPGFSLSDYQELRVPSFKRHLERNLRQELEGESSRSSSSTPSSAGTAASRGGSASCAT